MEFYITIDTQIENRHGHPELPNLTPDGYMTIEILASTPQPRQAAQRIADAALNGNWSNLYTLKPSAEFFPLGEQVRIVVAVHV